MEEDTEPINEQTNNNNNNQKFSERLLSKEQVESFDKETNFEKLEIENKDFSNKINSEINKDFNFKKISYPSNCFSSLTFGWVYDAIKQGKKNKHLQYDHLGELSSDYKSDKIFKEVEEKWNSKYCAYLERNNENKKKSIYPLFMTIIKANLCKIILAFILYILISALDFIGVIMFKELLRDFSQNKDSNSNDENENEDETGITFLQFFNLYQLMAIMIIHKIISLVVNRQTQFIAEVISIRTSTQLQLLIYDKLLKVPTFNMGEFNEGKIINLFQTDSESFGGFFINAGLVILVPLKVIYSCYLLTVYFKLAFIPGIIILIILGILFAIFRKKQKKYQNEWVKATDGRINETSKTFDIIKMLKLNLWENIFKNKINDKREIENKANYKKLNLQVIVATINGTVETLLMMICIIFYNLIYKQMQVENIMTSLYIVHELVEPLFKLPLFFVCLFETTISLNRIQSFLSIKNHDYSQVMYLSQNSESPYSIEISDVDFGVEKSNENANVNKSKDSNIKNIKKKSEIEKKIDTIENISLDNINNNLLKSQENEAIILIKDLNVKILKSEHIGIIGEVGSGKTSLLNAFINNLKVFPKNNENGNIKLSGNISFVSQNPWILNTTVEENILFFNPKDEQRYKKIVSICQLEQDFNSLHEGDKTIIGEKGINLSGGQKARLSIARAIYSNSEIYIFDDPLSALDAYVGMKLFKGVFDDFLKGKTFIISTHALQYLSFFDRIFYMKKGKIEWMGTYEEITKQEFYKEYSELITKNEQLHHNQNEEIKDLEDKEEDSDERKEALNRSLTILKKEKKNKCSTYKLFIKFSGGARMIIEILLSNIIWKVAQIYSDYYLSSWSSEKNLTEEENKFKLLIYVSITIPIIISVILRKKYMGDAYMRFNIRMHDLLIDKLINAPINLFHDITPRGYIINVLSKDLNTSSRVNIIFSGALRLGFQALGAIVVCCLFNIWTLPVIILIIILEAHFSKFCLQSLKDISRLEGIFRAPLIGVFSESLSGLSTIRSFQYEDKFKNKFNTKMNEYFKICLYQKGISGWYGLILDIISFGLFTFILVSCCVFRENYDPQSIGLLLTYSFNFINQFFNFMERFNDLTKMITSVERCENLTNIVQEKYPKLDTDELLPKNPTKNGKDTTFISNGTITFNNYSVNYRPKLPLVLKNLNFEIKPNEKIGVVGRTGSGKSTLCLSLFRLLEAKSGNIKIDNYDISEIGLETLRKNITIIPQEPILIKGSLRFNIDPNYCYTDQEIINILNEIGLDEFFKDKNINYEIEENGSNISVGEKQLICIARALVKKAKIILMDEATANIDYKTETFLQNSLNQTLKDYTVITIAHRIKTIINYDKILVLDKGEIIEFDTPQNLLNKKGLFYQLYKESFL